MSEALLPRVLADADVFGLSLLTPDPRDLRRDICQFVTFARENAIKRSHRENLIPKAMAKRLARLLSDPAEEAVVEEDGCGYWVEFVGRTARQLGVIHFAEKGVYAGYSSQSQTYPDNFITVQEDSWTAYLAASPLDKERQILQALTAMVPNEFFYAPCLVPLDCFSTDGSRIGPASRMALPHIRAALLELLAELPPDVWLEFRSFVDWVRHRAPHLILDPQTREADGLSQKKLREWEYANRFRKKSGPAVPRPAITLENLYLNFPEFRADGPTDRYNPNRRPGKLYDPDTPAGFHRVEGRYLERFLSQIPILTGMLELAFLPDADPRGLEVQPSFERLQAFRLRPHLRRVVQGDPGLNTVNLTVLPNFEVVVDAPVYPEREMTALAPFAVMVQEDRHLRRLRLDRKKVVAAAAARPADAEPVEVLLAQLTTRPVPENVRHELENWQGHGQKLTIYDQCGVVELRGDAPHAEQAAAVLADLVVERAAGHLIVRSPVQALEKLEAKAFFPVDVAHPEGCFAACDGLLASPAVRPRPVAPKKAAPPREKVVVATEDLAGLRCSSPRLLKALQEALGASTTPCLVVGGDLLVIPAASLPAARKALRGLAERFDVEG